MLKEIIEAKCLRNSIKDLNLSSIYLKHRETEEIPRLVTIYELNGLIKNSYSQINEIKGVISPNDNKYCLQGMLTLVITRFETLLLDLTTKIIKFYPEKLNEISKKENSDSSPAYLGLEKYIEYKIYKLGFKSVDEIIEKLFNLISSKQNNSLKNIDDHLIDELIEIKETRNLLVHNNLIVNQFYIQNTRKIKRSIKRGDLLSIDYNYLMKSIGTIQYFIEEIQLKILAKFQNQTLIELLKRLWEFTFTNKNLVKIENFCTLNYNSDSIDGPFEIDERYSSTETLYMEFWRAQRTARKIEGSFSMLILGSGETLSFLVDVFGELRMTYW